MYYGNISFLKSPCLISVVFLDPTIPDSNPFLKQASEAENIENLNGDEPIFWPLERKIDWKSEETWKHFSMSPRKDIIKVTALEETINMKKNLQKPKQGSKDCHNGGCKIRKGNTMPSRLRESPKVSEKIVPLNIESQILALKVEEGATMGSISTCRNLWEDDFTSNGDVPIEKVLGLGEFDGHEGIDSYFNEGVFLLDEALWLSSSNLIGKKFELG